MELARRSQLLRLVTLTYQRDAVINSAFARHSDTVKIAALFSVGSVDRARMTCRDERTENAAKSAKSVGWGLG